MTASARAASLEDTTPPPPYCDRQQQRAAADLGMWVFLTSETLFFGVLFFGYVVCRVRFPDAFAAASRHTDFALGTLNTAVLLTSSVTIVLAVRAAALGLRRAASMLMALTAILGIVFLAIKGYEYRLEYLHHLVPALDFRFQVADHDAAELFFWMYFVMTGFHALHLTVGIAVVGFVAVRVYRKGLRVQTPVSIEMTGLYWHFVDIVWIFMYPCLYLIARS